MLKNLEAEIAAAAAAITNPSPENDTRTRAQKISDAPKELQDFTPDKNVIPVALKIAADEDYQKKETAYVKAQAAWQKSNAPVEEEDKQTIALNKAMEGKTLSSGTEDELAKRNQRLLDRDNGKTELFGNMQNALDAMNQRIEVLADKWLPPTNNLPVNDRDAREKEVADIQRVLSATSPTAQDVQRIQKAQENNRPAPESGRHY